MPLHDTAKEQNVRSSLKKFFVDHFGTAVSFDKSVAHPDFRDPQYVKWVMIIFRGLQRSSLGEFYIEAYCATRQDPEGDELAKLSDEVAGLFFDATTTDGLARIPFYDTTNVSWELISAMVAQDIVDTPPFKLPEDETKVKILTIRFRWGMEI